MASPSKRTWVLIVLLFVGALIGSAIWSFLSPILSEPLRRSFTVGLINPWVLDIRFLTLTFGCKLELNIGAALGMGTAVLIYYKA